MTSVRGVSRFADRRRTVHEIVNVFRQAACGIEAAHRAGITHGDIKPCNIMIGTDGRVRVLDFGLAQTRRSDAEERIVGAPSFQAGPDDEHLTPPNVFAGTPAYMAPEQYLGLETDIFSDQFSFCVTLWEALYGQRPFPDGSFAGRALAENPQKFIRTPSEESRRIPRWIKAIVLRGLSPQREHRFQSMTALRGALEHGPKTRNIVLLSSAIAALLATAISLLGNQSLGGATIFYIVGPFVLFLLSLLLLIFQRRTIIYKPTAVEHIRVPSDSHLYNPAFASPSLGKLLTLPRLPLLVIGYAVALILPLLYLVYYRTDPLGAPSAYSIILILAIVLVFIGGGRR